jgi:O-acetyl-ADP-ribose deacetylase (regulator of RNase III)
MSFGTKFYKNISDIELKKLYLDLKKQVDDFISYAKNHTEKTFLLTSIGTGIAKIPQEIIAPLFLDALELKNVKMPLHFIKECYSYKQNIESIQQED